MNVEFCCIAFDETAYWHNLPKECTQVFGIYMFRVGEATYCASMTPASWCEFLENVFIGLDPEDPYVQEAWLEGSNNYFAFIRIDDPRHRLSREFSFETKTSDGRHDDAWEEAREYFRANPPYIPLP